MGRTTSPTQGQLENLFHKVLRPKQDSNKPGRRLRSYKSVARPLRHVRPTHPIYILQLLKLSHKLLPKNCYCITKTTICYNITTNLFLASYFNVISFKKFKQILLFYTFTFVYVKTFINGY